MNRDFFTTTHTQDTLCDGGQLPGSSSILQPPPPLTSLAAPHQGHPSNTPEGAAAAAASADDHDDDGDLDEFSDSLAVDLHRGDSPREPALGLDVLDSVPRKWNDSLEEDGEDSRSLDSLESGQTSFYSVPTGRAGSFQTLSPFGSEATLYLSEGWSTDTLYHSPGSSRISGLISRSCNELVPGHSASPSPEEEGEAQKLTVGRGLRREGSPKRHSFYGSLSYPVNPTERQVSDIFWSLDSYAAANAKGRKRSSTISAYPVKDEAPSFYSSDIRSRTSASARNQFLQANILKDGEEEKNEEGKHNDGGSEEEEEDDNNDGDDEEESSMSTQDDNTTVRAGMEGSDKEKKDRKGLMSSLRKNRKSGKKKSGKGPGGTAVKTDENDSTNSSLKKDDDDASSVTTVDSVASTEPSSPQIDSGAVNGRATPKGSNASSKNSSPALAKSPKSEKTDKGKLSSFLSRKDPKKKKSEITVSSSKTSIASSTVSEDAPTSSASMDAMATAEAGEGGGEAGGAGRSDSLKRDPGAAAAMASTKVSRDTSGRATPTSPSPASPSFRSFVSTMHVMKNESIMPSFDVHPKGSAMTRGTASVSELQMTPTVNSPKIRARVASPKSPKSIDYLAGRDSDGYSSSNPGSPAPGSPAPTVVKRPKIFSFNKNKEVKKDQPKKEKEKEEKNEREKENITPETTATTTTTTSTTTNSSAASADPQTPAEASAAKVRPSSPTSPIVVPVEPHALGRSPQPLSPQLYAPFTSELEKNLNKQSSLTEGSPAQAAPTKRTSLTETSIFQSLIRRASLTGSGSDQNIVKRPSTSDTASEQPVAKRAAVLGEAAAPASTEDLSGKPKATKTPPPSPPLQRAVPTDETLGIVARRANLFGGSKQSLVKRAESSEDNLAATPSGGERVTKSTSEKYLNRRSTALDQTDSSAATTAAMPSGATTDEGRSKTRSAEAGLDRVGRKGSEGAMPQEAVRIRNGRPPSSPPLSSPPSSPEGERGARETPEGDRDHSLPNPFVDSSGRITDSWAGASTDKREHLYKILVIGELGTGKTSIIKRYVHQFFSQHYRATIGVDFALKVLNWDSNTVVRLQLWDIAGQERFGNMTRVYYKEAVGAFIVFDVTRAQTFDAITKWKTDLDTKVTLPDGSPIPAVLLANKCDQPKEGVVNNPARMDDYCRERGFCGWFETSAKENINIDEAARFLVNKILSNERQGLMLNESIDPDKFSVDGKTKPADKTGCAC